MGRLSGVLTNSEYKAPVSRGRLSGIVTSDNARKEKESYYKKIERQQKMAAINENIRVAQENEAKANKNAAMWQGISNIPKQIYQAGKETLASIGDIATRMSPLEPVRNITSAVKEVVSPQYSGSGIVDNFQKGFNESRGRQTYFEKASGKQLTNQDGSINWDAGRQFIGRAMEAPTYLYSAASTGATMAARGLLSRIAIRTAKSLPEAAVNTGIQQFEEGTIKTAPLNLLANTLLMSGISNIAGEIKLSKLGIKKAISEIEVQTGPLSLTERADVIEALEQGLKPKTIAENAVKVKNNQFTPDEVAEVINKHIDSAPKALDPEVISKKATNSFLNTPEEALKKPNRLQGEGLSFTEAKTGVAKNGQDIPGRIVYGKNDAGKIILKDGRHLLEGYRQQGISIPEGKIALEDGVKMSDLAESIKPKSVKKTQSPILKKVNTMLDEASKVDDQLPTTSFKKQFSLADERIQADPKKAYNDAVYGGGKEDDITRSALQLSFLEKAKQSGDFKAVAEIGMSAARHGRKAGQEIVMFRSLYEADPMNKLLVDFANTKLHNIETRYPKFLKKLIKGEEGDIITATARAIKKKSVPLKDAQSIINSFICKI